MIAAEAVAGDDPIAAAIDAFPRDARGRARARPANTLAAYRRDLEGAEQLARQPCRRPIAPISRGSRADLGRSRARRPSRARLRRCASSSVSCTTRACAQDDPSAALPRPASGRPLPKILYAMRSRSPVRPGRAAKRESRAPAAAAAAGADRVALRLGPARDRAGLAAAGTRVPRDAPFLILTRQGRAASGWCRSPTAPAGAVALAGACVPARRQVPVSLAARSI